MQNIKTKVQTSKKHRNCCHCKISNVVAWSYKCVFFSCKKNQQRTVIYFFSWCLKCIKLFIINSQVEHTNTWKCLLYTHSYTHHQLVYCFLLYYAHMDTHKVRHCLNHPTVEVESELFGYWRAKRDRLVTKGYLWTEGCGFGGCERKRKTKKTKGRVKWKRVCVHRHTEARSKWNELCVKGWKLLDKLRTETFLRRAVFNI